MTETEAHIPPLTLACRRCGQMTTWSNNRFRPFCSERCQLIDLGAWANGDYSIPAESGRITPEDEDD